MSYHHLLGLDCHIYELHFEKTPITEIARLTRKHKGNVKRHCTPKTKKSLEIGQLT